MDGNTYLDFMAGVAVCSLGHSHPRYVAALNSQLRQVSVGSFTTENRVRPASPASPPSPPGR